MNNYEEELKKFKRKRFYESLFSTIIIICVFGICLFLALKYAPKPYSFEDRQNQLRRFKKC